MCRKLIIAAGLLTAIATQAPARPLEVVASLPPQAWLVSAIGGPEVQVEALVGPGDSPATYQPTDAQVTRLLAARALFRAGVPFEGGPWFRAAASLPGLEIIDLRAGIDLRLGDGRAASGHDGGRDPHVWLSPRRLAVQARTVTASLARLDPERRADYESRGAGVVDLLAELDRELTVTLAPYAGRAFVVFHPSWGYFAADYGLRQIAIEVDGKEPSDFDLTRITDLARREGIRTVFVQPQIRGRSAAAVASAVGAELATLDPLAPDVPANLRSVARRLVASFEP